MAKKVFNPVLAVLLVVLIILIVLFIVARIAFWIALVIVLVLLGIWVFRHLTAPQKDQQSPDKVTFGEKVFNTLNHL